MKIYFACSITGGRRYQPVYQLITTTLVADGHTVPTASLSDAGIMSLEQKVQPREVYERDVAWIQSSQVLVAEISTPSHGVGYEIAYALSLGKPVLCLYQHGQPVSKMLTGNTNPSILVQSYNTPEEAVTILRSFLAHLSL